MIALVIDENLRLMGQPAKRGRMDDAIAVPLKRRPHRMLGLRMESPTALLRLRRIGRETLRRDHAPNLRCAAAGVYPYAEARYLDASKAGLPDTQWD